ncbi:MAG: DegT/DnrJ/EryC1/StrS family aminotransferase [Thalassospira sp.]|uniref:DegT/DnrJ/EryC1/StrS family aminotransferase n=1 Tax=Thalassospira sp. TaxID=1912094 RepID=UPI003A881ED1
MRNIPFGKPIIGEEERRAVMEVLDGPQLVHGPRAKKFESNFSSVLGGGHAHSLASCTAGLHLAYVFLGLGEGDEVIVPAQTHVATAHAVEYTGAKPVFVDVDITTGNIDLNLVEEAITPRTRAICVVHYLGLPLDMDRVNELARKHDIFVVEDAALALGAKYKGRSAGLLGDVASFSFYPVKHITTAEGGMITTKHEHIANKFARLKAFGYDKMVGERVVPGLYDVDMLGYNYRMNELEAAIGVEQLKRLPALLQARKANDSVLRRELRNVPELQILSDGGGDFEHAHYCMVVVLEDQLASHRYEIIEAMKKSGVGVSIYYPGPVPHLTYYRDKYDLSNRAYENASRISNNSIALSVGPHLDSEDMLYTAAALKSAIQEVK